MSLKESNKGVIDQNGMTVDEIPAFIAHSRPGDVIAFDNRVWHASWGGIGCRAQHGQRLNRPHVRHAGSRRKLVDAKIRQLRSELLIASRAEPLAAVE